MSRDVKRARWRILTGVALAATASGRAEAQVPAVEPVYSVRPTVAGVTADSLVRMSSAELDALYRSAGPGNTPRGPVRGIPIVTPGSASGPAASKAARLVWQGKVFNDDGVSAVNRFFGIRAVRGHVYLAPSWLDGQSSLILDYQGTSLIYNRYRDEIREVAPGLYLGVMFARTEPGPRFTRYFAFESR